MFVRHGENMEIDDAVLSMTEKGATTVEWPLDRKIFSVGFFVVLVILFLLGARVFQMAILDGEKYRLSAERNTIRLFPISAPRGILYDRNGIRLVRNVPSLDLVLLQKDLPEDSYEREKIVIGVKNLFSVDEQVIRDAMVAKNIRPLDAILLKEGVSQDESIRFFSMTEMLPGINLRKSVIREYEDSSIFSHIVGYEGKIRKDELEGLEGYLPTDGIGRDGVEKTYEQYLKGERGFLRAEVDSVGVIQRELGTIEPKPGKDLLLNIDSNLQKKIYDSLESTLEKNNLKRGAAIALDPRDGSVLALVNIPSYENNLFSKGISDEEYRRLIEDESKPLFNRAIAGEYPPGSTLKPVIAAAALSEGIITENRQIESRGGINVGSFFFGDWKAHGFTDIRRAIAVSSDVYFYSIGGGYGGISGLGMERMKKYENLFGYGELSGIDLPSEGDGFLPDPEWKKRRFNERWYVGDDYNASIGQGFITATPLQVVNSIAAIANGGTLYEPHIGRAIRSLDGSTEYIAPVVKRKNIIDPYILHIVREGMRQTVTDGTATILSDLPVAVAGKTGTAQFRNDKENTHGWFVSFAPYENPVIAMIVLVEGQGESGYFAVPITKEVYEWYFRENQGG